MERFHVANKVPDRIQCKLYEMLQQWLLLICIGSAQSKIPRLSVALNISVCSTLSLTNFDKCKHTDKKKFLFKRKFERGTFHCRDALSLDWTQCKLTQTKTFARSAHEKLHELGLRNFYRWCWRTHMYFRLRSAWRAIERVGWGITQSVSFELFCCGRTPTVSRRRLFPKKCLLGWYVQLKEDRLLLVCPSSPYQGWIRPPGRFHFERVFAL